MNLKINFLQKKKKYSKGGSNIKPDVYWMYIFIFIIFLILAFCVWGIILFKNVNEEDILPKTELPQEDIFSKERVNDALYFFEKRELKSFEILNNPSPVVDPSI